MWEEGDPKSWALNAISAMVHFMPAVRGKTPGSSRLMNGWTKTELLERAPPLPTLFATAVAGAALRRQDLRLCVLILIAFHALLRTGRVQASHFVRPGKAGPIFLTLSNTKSGIRRGDLAESVVLTDPVLIQYLHVLLTRILPVSTCGQRILSLFEHIFASCAQTPGSHHYLGGHTRSEEAAQRRIFSSLAPWTKQLFEGDGSPLEPQDCTLMKVSRRSHPLCPRRPKSVTSDLWRQVWPLHRCPFGNCMVTHRGPK